MINDFFTHPMRIFFLTSAVCAVLGGAIFFTPVDFVSWHKFIFLHLVAALAYAGFLLTGLTDWTNFGGGLKKHAYAMFSFFAASFVSAFFSLFAAHFFMALFWAYLAGLCVYMIWLDRNDDQLGVLAFLLGILGFEIYYLLSGEEKFLNLQIHLHVIAILLISFRVSAILAKLKEWHYKELLRHSFVIYYYLMQLLLAAAYILYGASGILGLGLETNMLHVIALNGIIFSIMLIFNIAGLRHSGQELEFLRLSKIAFALVIAAGVCRGFLAYVWSGFYIHLPATLIAVAFGLWFIDFYKIFRDNEFSDDPE